MLVLSLSAGCRSQGERPQTRAPSKPPPPYTEIATAHNERVARLVRLWARGSAVITWVDDTGRTRSEQGEGHFQVIQPSRMALSIGKLGEVLFWLGCDEDRAWAIWTRDDKRAIVGPHSAETRLALARLGIAAAPRDLIRLAGLAPLPDGPPASGPEWADESLVRFDIELGPADGAWRYWFDPISMLPRRVALLDAPGADVLVTASLDVYAPVTLRNEGGFFPHAPTRLRIRHEPSGSVASLTLESMNDGGGPRLAPANFDLGALLRAYNVTDIAVLDHADTR